MKWFKHFSNSADDREMEVAVGLLGGDAYYFYYICIEIMAENLDINYPNNCKILSSIFKKRIALSPQKINKCFAYFGQNSMEKYHLSSHTKGAYTYLYCPKMKHLVDEWTKKQLRSNGKDVLRSDAPDLGGYEENRRDKKSTLEEKLRERGGESLSLFSVLLKEEFSDLNKSDFRESYEKWIVNLEKKNRAPTAEAMRLDLENARRTGPEMASEWIRTAFINGYARWFYADRLEEKAAPASGSTPLSTGQEVESIADIKRRMAGETKKDTSI